MRKLTPLLGPAIVLGLWGVAGYAKILNPLFIPPLPDVARSLASLTRDGVLLRDVVSTMWRTTTGFAGAALIGIPAGLLLGSIQPLRSATGLLVDFFRSIPGIALFPLFLLFFGLGDRAKIANVVFAAGLVIVVNAMYGVRNANRTRILAAKTMAATPRQVYTQVILPGALPEIVGGLRIAISISLIVIVVTEMFVGTQFGLGKRVFSAYQLFRISDMYAAILVTGGVGYGLNQAIEWLERRFVHWAGK